jgi:hypothetical protein
MLYGMLAFPAEPAAGATSEPLRMERSLRIPHS